MLEFRVFGLSLGFWHLGIKSCAGKADVEQISMIRNFGATLDWIDNIDPGYHCLPAIPYLG